MPKVLGIRLIERDPGSLFLITGATKTPIADDPLYEPHREERYKAHQSRLTEEECTAFESAHWNYVRDLQVEDQRIGNTIGTNYKPSAAAIREVYQAYENKERPITLPVFKRDITVAFATPEMKVKHACNKDFNLGLSNRLGLAALDEILGGDQESAFRSLFSPTACVECITNAHGCRLHGDNSSTDGVNACHFCTRRKT